MYLDITIFEKGDNKKSILGKKVNCVEDLFLRHFTKKAITKPFVKVNIYLTTNVSEEGKLDAIANMIDYYTVFDFHKYGSLHSNYERKKYLLDLILKVLLNIAEIKAWPTDFFLDAYNGCLKDDLKNEWWFKSKLFSNPGKEFFIGLRNVYDIDGYEIYLVLFDRKKNELSRLLVFRDDVMIFELELPVGRAPNDLFLNLMDLRRGLHCPLVTF